MDGYVLRRDGEERPWRADQRWSNHHPRVLCLYTADNAWFLGPKWEKKLGTIEKGKWADIVVLNADYFDPSRVSDEQVMVARNAVAVD